MEPKDLKNSDELKNAEELKDKKTGETKTDETPDSKPVEAEKKPEEQVDAGAEKKSVPESPVEEKMSNDSVVTEKKQEPEKKGTEEKTKSESSEEKEKKEEQPSDKKEKKSEVAEDKAVEQQITEDKTKDSEEKPENTKQDAEPATQKNIKEAENTGTDVAAEQATDRKKEETATEEKTTAAKGKKKAEKVSIPEKSSGVSDKKSPEKKKTAEKEKIDYSIYSQLELVNALRDILNEAEDFKIKDEVETIKSVFYKNLNDNIEEAKKKFLDQGGDEDSFKAEEDPYENDIKDLLKRYRQLRFEFNKKLEVEKEENLKLKYQVIEEIKGLINTEESINKTFNEFRDLQRQWREIGLVPQSKMKNLWETYHFHVEQFYDYIKINKELRDLDLKKNLEAKIKLCERAEELLVEPSILKAFKILQKYHDRWREIGPVPLEQKDDIWERFKAATSKINKKHQEFFDNRKAEQRKNLEAKTALCEKVEEVATEEINNHKEWDKKSKEIIELQKVWRTIGFAPRKDNNKIYERFRTACDNFFDAKRAFYAKNKELQQNNLQLKIDLCVQAEALKDNTDWKKTTQDFITIQKKWKEIGPVPRKHSDIVWKRFRTACDYFFEKKSEHFSEVDSEYVENLKKKEELIQDVTNFKASDNVDENLNSLKMFQRRWSEIGHVPFKKKDDIQNKYRQAINTLFDELKIDENQRDLLKFRSKVSTYKDSNRGQNKLRMEREKYMNKLKQFENDLVLLNNNIGFFTKSKNAESLIKDVKKKIEATKQKIEFLKNKIRVIDEMDHSEE